MIQSRIVKGVILIFFGLLISCNQEDVIPPAENFEPDTISGIWHLTSVGGGLLPARPRNRGEVVWDFNEENNTLTIQNIVTTDYDNEEYVSLSVLNSGTYTYELREFSDGTLDLYINTNSSGVLSFWNGHLNIDGGSAADGPIYSFSR